ncbi:MAG: hypothetical protein P9L98_05130 [Candidatus Kaelpia imicola]|nr:hypothetical protein [Candidatus Kaelpia imicola]
MKRIKFNNMIFCIIDAREGRCQDRSRNSNKYVFNLVKKEEGKMKKFLALVVLVALCTTPAFGQVGDGFVAPEIASDDVGLVASTAAAPFVVDWGTKAASAFGNATTFSGVIGGALCVAINIQELDPSSIDFTKIEIDYATGVLTASPGALPTGVDLDKLAASMKSSVSISETLLSWDASSGTTVKLDDNGSPVNEDGKVIIDAEGNTEDPTGSVSTYDLASYKVQLQKVENFQEALGLARTTSQKKTAIADLAEAATLLVNMDNGF